MMPPRKSIAVKIYRISRFFNTRHCRPLARFFKAINHILFGCVIPPSAILENDVSIAHAVGVIIHQDAVIGEGTTIYQNVTIGSKPLTIGKKCFIGAGAVVLADLGDHVTVGANAVVLHPVPDNCTAVGVPARIINPGNKIELENDRTTPRGRTSK